MARKIGSRYTAHQVIGRGSAGTVWLGEGPEGPVAIKLLREDLAADQVLVGRFVQERTALTSLDHPRVVGVHDLVVDGDDLALVMELVHGADLRARLDREGPLTPQAAVSIAADVAEGLAVAHAAGIVHRDVKPENILLDQASSPGPGGAPRAKLSDFGIARLVDAPRRTRATRIIGTPDYLAPEVIEGLEPRAAVDIYALATVLYELLAGFTPFGGGHTGAVLRRHVTEAVSPLPGLPDALWKVIAQCLSKAPASRLRASELAARLREQLPSLAGLPVLTVSHPDSPAAGAAGEYDDEYDPHDPEDGEGDAYSSEDGYGQEGGARSGRGRRRRGPAVPLVPGAQPDSNRDTHTSLRRPSREELASFAAASRSERAARGGGPGRPESAGTHRHGGARRGGSGPSVRRRRRILAGVLALLVVVGAVGAYEAFAGGTDGADGSGAPAVGGSAKPHPGAGRATRAVATALPQAPVAAQNDGSSSVDASAAGTPAAAVLPSWTAWSAAPAPPVPLVGGVSAVRLGDTAYAFGTGSDGYVRYLTRSPAGAFGGWGKLTGIQVSGEPAAVVLSDGRLSLFARGTDGLVYQRTLTNGQWTASAWGKLDGRTRVDSPPAATVFGDRIDLVARIGGDLVTTSFVDGEWSVWQTVPTVGRITGTPALVGEGNGRIDAFAAARDGGQVLRTQAVNGVWHPGQPVTGLAGIPATGRPGAVQAAHGVQYAFTPAGAEAAGGAGSAGGAHWTDGTLPAAASGETAAYADGSDGVGLFLLTPSGTVRYTHTR